MSNHNNFCDWMRDVGYETEYKGERRKKTMRWHHIAKDEWPEETGTMVLCRYLGESHKEYESYRYAVAMYIVWRGKREFVDDRSDETIKNVDAWIALDDINEQIYWDGLYEEQRLRQIGKENEQ